VKRVRAIVGLGLCGFVVLPWYAIEEGVFATEWLVDYPLDRELAPALLQASLHGRWWLLPLLGALVAPLVAPRPRALVAAGLAGLGWVMVQGLAIGPLGPSWPVLEELALGRQYGMGAGALVVQVALVLLLCEGLARRGALGGDVFATSALGLAAAFVLVFVVWPVAAVLAGAFGSEQGSISLALFWSNLTAPRLRAVAGSSLVLAVLTGAGTTFLGLCLALAVTRTRLRGSRLLRGLSILPVVTPPFVLGLGLILVFGRAGLVTSLLEETFGIEPSRYIFGLQGVWLAQLLAFTPVAFLMILGVVQGVSPSLEEAAASLGARPWRAFWTVTLPLLRPGLAAAFLVGFVESLADFGNPLTLGGSDLDVLSTEIYFAVAGAQSDVPRAAAMAIVLLCLTLGAFAAQRRWMGRAGYATVTGKGDPGLGQALPRGLERAVVVLSIAWTVFTFAVYGVVLLGGLVRSAGRDNSLTLDHFRALFEAGALSSLGTSLELSLVAAPLSAVLGLVVAWLLARQKFRGRRAFELATMLAFAVPGTVVGIGYVLCFNVPPWELTGTGAILVLAFVVRNMPVGVRAGLATLAQIDPSLEEASRTLGAGTAATMRRVVLPLLRPAVLTALIYGFARAMTAVSAVIFLVGADHSLATTYILARVEAGEYGRAIAYSSVLIVLMLAVIGVFQWFVGERRLGRRSLA
jgi:iron(III) transport system permease protein